MHTHRHRDRVNQPSSQSQKRSGEKCAPQQLHLYSTRDFCAYVRMPEQCIIRSSMKWNVLERALSISSHICCRWCRFVAGHQIYHIVHLAVCNTLTFALCIFFASTMPQCSWTYWGIDFSVCIYIWYCTQSVNENLSAHTHSERSATQRRTEEEEKALKTRKKNATRHNQRDFF